MIRSLAFTKASGLFQHMRDISPDSVLFAAEGTPVATLASPVIQPALFIDKDADDFQSTASITSMLERNASYPTGTDTHEMALKNFVELASGAIRNTVYLTKTVALPVIESITTDAETRLNEVNGGTGLALSIVPDTQALILVNPTLASAVEPFSQVARRNTETINVHHPRDSEMCLELIKVGYNDFDTEMEQWLSAHFSTEMVTEVYNRVFSNASTTTYMSNVFDNIEDSYPEALVCFLLARGLILSTDEKINMSASTYDLAMSMVTNYSALIIKNAIIRFQRADRNSRVVLRYPPAGQELSYDRPEKGVIVVNKAVYDKFLNEGGSPETIMGSYLLDRKTDSAELMTNRDRYVSHYNARVLKTRSDSRLRSTISIRRFIEREINQHIVHAGPDAEEKGLWSGITIDQVAAQKRLRVNIDAISADMLDDMYSTIRRIILDIFFVDTDVAQLISLIDSNSKMNPDDLKNAVNIAVVDYIVDWLMAQTTFGSY